MPGQDFDALKKQAATRDFKPVPLGVDGVDDDHEHAAHDRLAQRAREARGVGSRAQGRVRRSTPRTGITLAKNADGIFHGAEDDALGCAALIEMARAFTKLPTPPRRSILFLAVTAEEQGLLGIGSSTR